jgi:hypothetical protein
MGNIDFETVTSILFSLTGSADTQEWFVMLPFLHSLPNLAQSGSGARNGYSYECQLQTIATGYQGTLKIHFDANNHLTGFDTLKANNVLESQNVDPLTTKVESIQNYLGNTSGQLVQFTSDYERLRFDNTWIMSGVIIDDYMVAIKRAFLVIVDYEPTPIMLECMKTGNPVM